MTNQKPRLLLKKELPLDEIHDIVSGYVVDRYGNAKVREHSIKGKFLVRFEYRTVPETQETSVIVEVYAPRS